MRQRRISDGEILWKFNSKDNVDLFGRYHPQDDIEFADGNLLVGFMVKPGKASVVVTDDVVLELVVRDDLSALANARGFARSKSSSRASDCASTHPRTAGNAAAG